MGVAAGRDSRGIRGYAMLIAKGDSSYTRGYSYRWSKAVADGAGTHSYLVGRPLTGTVTIGQPHFQGTTLLIPIQAPKGISVRCSLSRRVGGHWHRARLRRCGKVARFTGLRRGEYRLRVQSALGTEIRDYTVT